MAGITIKDLALKVNISEGTIRSWIMKPEQGKTYSAENINYTNLREKLHKYYPREEEFEKLAGCKIDEVEIVKAERVAKVWVTYKELEEHEKYTIHNYSLKTNVEFCGIFKTICTRYETPVDVYVFLTDKSEFKAYTINDLLKENIKIEKI